MKTFHAGEGRRVSAMRSMFWLIGLPVSWAAARFGVMHQARINADFYGGARRGN